MVRCSLIHPLSSVYHYFLPIDSASVASQDHYDFGMRAIKAVLVMAGQKKRHIQIRYVALCFFELSQSDKN